MAPLLRFSVKIPSSSFTLVDALLSGRQYYNDQDVMGIYITSEMVAKDFKRTSLRLGSETEV